MSLEDLRQEIDQIDERIVDLLVKRAETAKQIGAEKRKDDTPVQDSGRESKVVDRAKERSAGRLDDAALESIYRRIIGMCTEVQADNEI